MGFDARYRLSARVPAPGFERVRVGDRQAPHLVGIEEVVNIVVTYKINSNKITILICYQ